LSKNMVEGPVSREEPPGEDSFAGADWQARQSSGSERWPCVLCVPKVLCVPTALIYCVTKGRVASHVARRTGLFCSMAGNGLVVDLQEETGWMRMEEFRQKRIKPKQHQNLNSSVIQKCRREPGGLWSSSHSLMPSKAVTRQIPGLCSRSHLNPQRMAIGKYQPRSCRLVGGILAWSGAGNIKNRILVNGVLELVVEDKRESAAEELRISEDEAVF